MCEAAAVESEADVHIVLVHGTWGRGIVPFFLSKYASWCEDGSALRHALLNAVGSANVEFSVFNWSGANTTAARAKAATAFGTLIRQLRQASPDRPIHVVAHSHGGNIVMYACRDHDVREAISSAAFLSTPFIHVAPRELGSRFAPRVEKVAVALAVSFILILLVASGLVGKFVDLIPHIPWWLEFFVRAGLWAAFGALIGTAAVAVNVLHEKSHKLATSLALPQTVPFPTLILRSTADEASNALALPQLMSSILTRVLRLLLAVTPVGGERIQDDFWLSRLTRFCLWWLVVPGGALTAVVLTAYLMALDQRFWLGWLVAAAVAIVVLGILIFVLTIALTLLLIPIIWLIFVVLALAAVPFGGTLAFAALSLQISAESTPPGAWLVLQMPPRRDLSGDSGLGHSTHSDPDAIGALATWLSELATSR